MENRINQQIKGEEVRLVQMPASHKDGIYHVAEALKIANSLGFDLIEISSKSSPSICRMMEFSKFQYEQKRKENKKNQKAIQLKEIGLSPDF